MKFSALLTLAAAALALAAPNQDLAARDDPRDNPQIPGVEDGEFIKAILDAHWYWRKIHCAQELQWNATLANMARDDIRKCEQDLQHHRGGSNLSGRGPPPQGRDKWLEWARVAVHGWHEEEAFYDYSKRESISDRNIYHFTQLVWRDSRQIGCALTDCTVRPEIVYTGRIYCYYDPIGNNVAGNAMQENVWPPVCRDPSRAELEQKYGH